MWHTHKYEHIHISLVSPQSHTCLKRYWFSCLFKVLSQSPTRPSECFFLSCLNLIRFPKRRKHTADEASEQRGMHERATRRVPEKGNSLEFTTQQTSFLACRDETRRQWDVTEPPCLRTFSEQHQEAPTSDWLMSHKASHSWLHFCWNCFQLLQVSRWLLACCGPLRKTGLPIVEEPRLQKNSSLIYFGSVSVSLRTVLV